MLNQLFQLLLTLDLIIPMVNEANCVPLSTPCILRVAHHALEQAVELGLLELRYDLLISLAVHNQSLKTGKYKRIVTNQAPRWASGWLAGHFPLSGT